MASHYPSMSHLSTNTNNHNRTSTMQNSGSHQVSTTTLLNSLHTAFANSQPYALESSTSLVVNTWASGQIVDAELAGKAWEHARRRAEDGCIVLGSLHQSSPSLFQPFIGSLPLAVPNAFYTALAALRPFLHCSTSFNPSLPCYSALSAVFTLSVEGDIQGASLGLSTSGIDTKQGLLRVSSEPGNRAFDVFYYLLTSATPPEREFLQLKAPSQYTLLKKSGTYIAPSYLPTADDAASAEDWRESLKALGIRGGDFRNLLCTLAAILRLGDAIGFLIDQEELEAVCEEVADLIEVEPDVLIKKCHTEEREVLISGIYEATVDWVITRLNDAIRHEMRAGNAIGSSSGSEAGMATPPSSNDEAVSASITVVDIPSQLLGRAVSLKTVLDDSTGINAEMKEDGVRFVPPGHSVVKEMKDAVSHCEADLNIQGGPSARDREHELERRQTALEKVSEDAEPDIFLRKILYPVSGEGINLGKTGRFSLRDVIESSRVWFQLCLHPSEEAPATIVNGGSQNFSWSAGCVSSQIRTWRIAEWANHRNKQLDFTADFDFDEFVDRYSRLGCQGGKEGVEAWLMERGWSNGEVVVGAERIWLRESAWWEAESMLDMKQADDASTGDMLGGMVGAGGMESRYSLATPGALEKPFFAQPYSDNASREDLMQRQPSQIAPSAMGARSLAPTAMQSVRQASGGDYGLGRKGDEKHDDITYEGELDPELLEGKDIVHQKQTLGRRIWVGCAWAVTFFIPSFLLKHVGRMKRPDVRLAWREKILLMIIILFLNGFIVFYIVAFGNLICPKWNKAWNEKEVGYHQGSNDYWVSHMGVVYDLTDFAKTQHSDTDIKTTSDMMEPFGGSDMTGYITPPLWLACPGLVDEDDKTLKLLQNETLPNTQGDHSSGEQSPYTDSALAKPNWYNKKFLPKMDEFRKGDLVTSKSKIHQEGKDDQHPWFIMEGNVYDLTDYFHTLDVMDNYPGYTFFPDEFTELVQSNPGKDITKEYEDIMDANNRTTVKTCLGYRFYIGKTDFRETAKCQVNNYILLAFTILLCAVILTKFLAALQFGSKRRPAQQDKFVIAQIPAYTEGEDQLRKGLDSLTALAYDNKRKLICVICDGMIVGGGNDRPTPKIVLDVLGVDPKVDPPALPFKSIGTGSEQLNYGKVYSGLYEFEGNVVPYVVVVKVGKESEQSKPKPGNRGKRDSQILLMSFLNRVHHRSSMSPLELEMFHQINNIIGVDPELYEYLFMVDADTQVHEDSLNRLVAACANDAKIAGICGETSLQNEEGSWWTMIQVYEYYISHHLAKAFESLFASVTCLPGCFSMYRLRTADRGRPLIISNQVIKDYADIGIDTLHKKNLLSLGEDRFLTTLMTKHFPKMAYKFVPDAYAQTEAPAEWSVLLSQRRRWINSTIHNLFELVMLKDLCGFCCFSMRFVVFIDLFGTIILPATCTYLVYIIVRVASGTGQFPLISIVMLAGVYGLQALIFLLKRQWQHIGWMIIYILAYPIYSFILPLYSFWKQDDFSWGNTRVVIQEAGSKKVIATDDEGFDPRTIPLQRWDDYALANGLPGRRSDREKDSAADYYDNGHAPPGYELDDMRSVYSSAKPASTILTGFPQHQMYQPPQSPAPFAQYGNNRQSVYSHMSGPQFGSTGFYGQHPPQHQGAGIYTDHPAGAHNRMMSQSALSDFPGAQPSQHHQRASSPFGIPAHQTPLPPSRPASTNALSTFNPASAGPSHEAITQAVRELLLEVDIDNVTKKQLKALTEAKLQCQLGAEKRAWVDGVIDRELANM